MRHTLASTLGSRTRQLLQKGASLIACAALIACGGGGGPSDGPGGPGDGDLTFNSDLQRDGYVASDGSFFLSESTGNGCRVGDIDGEAPGFEARAVFAFDISAIPAGATITTATLSAPQLAPVGSPYSKHGAVVVDHIEIQGQLDETEFSGEITSNIGTLSSDTALGSKTLSVTAAVQAALDGGTGLAGFRARAATLAASDGGSDYALFNDGDDSGGTGVLPTLQVLFTPAP